MNNDIKEILNKINENKDEIKTHCYYPDDILNCDDLIILLDYITNLQERFDALLKAHKIADELETEYQERNEKAIEETKLGIQVLEDTKESYPMISCDVVINRYLKPILKSLGEDKDD